MSGSGYQPRATGLPPGPPPKSGSSVKGPATKTLRDEFAMAALIALWSNAERGNIHWKGDVGVAFEIADLMMKERGQ